VSAQDAAAPVVTSSADPGDGTCAAAGTGDGCTLREAVAFASDGATITFDPALTAGGAATITLAEASGELGIFKSLTITGPTSGNGITLDGGYRIRLVAVGGSVTVNLSYLTFMRGHAVGGGAIDNAGTLRLSHCTMRDNSAFGGGAIFHRHGSLFISRCDFSGNIAEDGGGAIYALDASSIIDEATFAGNSASGLGGAIRAIYGSHTIMRSTISANSASEGAVVLNQVTSASITGTTISGNQSSGVYVRGPTFGVAIAFSTITGNVRQDGSGNGGGGVFADNAAVTIDGSIIAGNTSLGFSGADDAVNSISSSGEKGPIPGDYNVFGVVSASISSTNLTGFDATTLGALANNGGPTRTHALNAGSPAIDLVPTGTIGCGSTVQTDQRGVARPSNGKCDAGAFEYQAPVVYAFSGFLAPVNDLPTANVVKAGSGIPVKFGLGGNLGLAIFATGSPASQQVACSTASGTDPVEQTVTAGASALSYDATTGTYTYIWKSDKAWAGTCRLLTLRMTDGTNHQAFFQFTK
jgi:predicted outer membrane repeat protein